MNICVLQEIITKVATTPRRQVIQPLKIIGMVVSKTSTSLPNLFKILPCGVVSKNDKGDLKIFFNILLCKVLLPLRVDKYNNNDPHTALMACPRPKRPQTPRQVYLMSSVNSNVELSSVIFGYTQTQVGTQVQFLKSSSFPSSDHLASQTLDTKN